MERAFFDDFEWTKSEVLELFVRGRADVLAPFGKAVGVALASAETCTEFVRGFHLNGGEDETCGGALSGMALFGGHGRDAAAGDVLDILSRNFAAVGDRARMDGEAVAMLL